MGASVFCLAALAAGQDTTEDKCVLEGTVRNSVTRTAIGKASIHLIPVDGSAGYKGTTSAAGTFHFEGIESGTYRIQVERAGYRDSQFAAIQSGWAGAILHFSAGQKLSGAEILLTPYGGIRGKITGPDGEPLRGVRVSAIEQTWQRGKRSYAGFNVETDGTGTYHFEDIAPGRYYIYAKAPSQGPLAGVIVEEPGMPEMRLAGGYHPVAAAWEGAAPVEVQAGMETSEIDLRMRLAPAFHVRGKMERPEKAEVRLSGRVNDQTCDWDMVSGTVQNDGSFDIGGVAPGEYFLYAMKGVETDFGFRPVSGAKVPVKVTDRSLDGLIAPALSHLELRGRIRLPEDAGQSSVPPVNINFEGSEAPLWDIGRHANFKPDGTFSVSNLTPDRYAVRLVTRETDGLDLKSLLYNGQEVEKASIDLTGGVVGELEPVLGAGAGRVEGTVLLPEGREQSPMEPGDELWVVLAPVKIPVDTRLDRHGGGPKRLFLTPKLGAWHLSGFRCGQL